MTDGHADETGIYADLSALSGYASRNAGLADDVGGVSGTLACSRSLPADLLGDLGEETGLHGELATHINDLHSHVGELSGSVGGLGIAVNRARGDYEQDEQDRATNFRGFES